MIDFVIVLHAIDSRCESIQVLLNLRQSILARHHPFAFKLDGADKVTAHELAFVPTVLIVQGKGACCLKVENRLRDKLGSSLRRAWHLRRQRLYQVVLFFAPFVRPRDVHEDRPPATWEFLALYLITWDAENQ